MIATFAADRPGSRLVINGVEQADPISPSAGSTGSEPSAPTLAGVLARIESETLWSSQPQARGAVVTQTGD